MLTRPILALAACLIAATALWPAITPPTREWDDYADHLEGPL